ncbi:hypothetical protein GCM10009737_32690 [Nocardioides lentus]|uniref:SipW-cognate class signal peptide n=1 Tax=Nocardioides lentus TaxID=338077 RepID=A0ABN2PPV3_9ACTN
MSRHRAEGGGRGPGRRATPAPTRHRLALLVALAVALLVGIGGAGTYAFWNDRADIDTGAVASGSMDLRVDDQAIGRNTGYAKTAIAFSGRTPGEFETYDLRLRNVGRATGTYTLAVLRGGSWSYTEDAITVQAWSGTAQDDPTSYPERDTCSGSLLGAAQVFPTATPQALITTPRTLVGNAEETICVRVGIATSATDVSQDKTGTLQLRAILTQVT